MILTDVSDIRVPFSRIISLVPSQTELLFDLGLDPEVLGITRFCVHPSHWYTGKPRVGGTKSLNTEKIHDLKPDLIIANREENMKDQIEELAQHYSVWVTDVATIDDANKMILDLGILTGKSGQSKRLVDEISDVFDNWQKSRMPAKKPSIAYLIWRDPYMTVGGDTFIHHMLELAGYENVFSKKLRYPECSLNDLQQSGCDIIMLSSEPYHFTEKHIRELSDLLPDKKIILVDGEIFSWYGSRMRVAPSYFQELLAMIG